MEGVEQTDEARVAAARAGDAAALEGLFAKYRAPLEMLLLRSIPPALRSKVSVSDILQETFAAVWQSLDTFEDQGAGSFRAWLLRVANHRALDALRRYRSARRAVTREVADPEAAHGVPSADPTPSSLAIAEELEERLRTSLPTLPDDHRQILQLVLVEGLSMVEAGRRLGRSANAAQKLYARAKDGLWRLCGLDRA